VKATLVALAVAALTAGMAGCAVTPADPSSQAVNQPTSEPYRSFYYSYPNPISYPGDASRSINYDRRGW
jgi:hypothetical protein